MGWMSYKDNEGNTYLWGDRPQDEIDEFLEKNGLKETSTNEKKKELFKKATADKKLNDFFKNLWGDKFGKKLKLSEFQFHVCFGLGSPDIEECSKFKSWELVEH